MKDLHTPDAKLSLCAQICNCIPVGPVEIAWMECEEKQLGAHGGGIPPGWDFPEAREAAAMGLDLWLLDSAMKQSPAERLEAATNGARSLAMLRTAGEQTHAA